MKQGQAMIGQGAFAALRVQPDGIRHDGCRRLLALLGLMMACMLPSIALAAVSPSNLSYLPSAYSFTVGTPGTTATPTHDGDPLTGCTVAPALPAGLTIGGDCTIAGMPTAAAATSDYVVTASNPAGSVSATVTITVDDAAPTGLAYSPNIYVFTKGEASTTATPTHAGGSLTYCTTSPALSAGLTISQSDCTISGTPTALSTMPISYAVIATNSGGSTIAVVKITVNDMPPSSLAYSSGSYVFTIGQASTTGAPAHAGGTLTHCTVSPALPAGLNINPGDCTISGTPTALSTTPTSYAVTAGNSGGSAMATMTIAVVTPPVPTVVARSVTTPYDTAANIDLGSSITGANITAVTIGTAPAHGTASVSDKTVTYTPSPTFYGGSDSFTYTATNPGGSSAPATVTITIGLPAAPTAAAKAVTTAYDTAASIDLGSSITGVNVTAVTIGTAPAHGTASVSGKTVTYTPSPTFYGGSDSFTYIAANSGGSSVPAKVSVQVTPLSVPVARAMAVSTTTGIPVLIRTGSETTGPNPSTGVSVASAPAHGRVEASGEQLIYTPVAGYVGTDSFTYRASNHFGSSTPATITVSVTAAGSVGAADGTRAVVAAPATPVTVDLGSIVPGSYVSTQVVGFSPVDAGSFALSQPTTLTFVSATTFRGLVQVNAVLTAASGRQVTINLLVLVSSQPDPSKNPTVLGLINAQTTTAQRFAQSQLDNVNNRLESLHDGGGSALFTNALSVSLDGKPLRSPSTNRPATTDPHNPASGDSSHGPGSLMRSGIGAGEATTGESMPTDPPAAGTANGSGSPARSQGGLGVWVGGTASFGSFEAYRQAAAFDSDDIAVNAGIDQQLGRYGLVGVSLGYNHDNSSISRDGTRSIAKGYSGALYGSYQPAAKLYIDVVMGGGRLNFDSRRHDDDTGNFLVGSRHGNQWFGALTAGYEYHSKRRLLLSPYLRLEQSLSTLDGFSESGVATAALAYGRQTVRTSLAVVGLRASGQVALSCGTLSPHARLEIGHDFQGVGNTTLGYAFIPSAGTWNALTNPYSANGTRVQVGLGLDLQLRHNLLLTTGYDYLTQPHAHDQMIRLGVKKQF